MVIKSSPELTLMAIAELWVKWNSREITASEFVYKVEEMLKKETKKAWREYNLQRVTDPLKKLLVRAP